MERKVLFSTSMDSIVDENVDGIITPDNTITHMTSDNVVVGDKITNRYGNKSTISTFYGDLNASNDNKSDDTISDAEFFEVSDDNSRGIHLKDHLYKKNYTKKRHKRK